MQILGYIAAILIGLVLGSIGGGGSILTVPVLVYLMDLSPITATSYSLFVVGSSSLVGALSAKKKNQLDTKAVFMFGLPAIASVFATRAYVLPALPSVLFTISGIEITKDMGIMLLFAILMVTSSIFMIKPQKFKPNQGDYSATTRYPLLLIEGLLVGLITGLLGAGGGFLIIPGLVLLARLPMKIAIGTSLAIIAINSFIGFVVDLGHFTIDWKFLLPFTALAVAGIFLGSRLSKNVAGYKLKPAFGWFVLIMGIIIIGKELI